MVNNPPTVKACPCCEAGAEIRFYGQPDLQLRYYIICTTCGLNTGTQVSMEIAAAHWNRRAAVISVPRNE